MKPPTCHFNVEFLGLLVMRKSILPCGNLRLASTVCPGSTLSFGDIKAMLLETSRVKSTERGSSVVSSYCVCASCIASLRYPALFSSSSCVLKLALPLYCSVASLHNPCHDCLLTSRFAGPQADGVAAAWSLACGPDLFQQGWHCHPSQLRVNTP